MARHRGLAITALLAALMAVPATAQSRDQVQVFPAEYFASAHPADAYDMVRKLPGFDLIETDEGVRGFTGSRGNVLFDGRSPSSKQESLEQMLRRIPASNVLRIELIRGGSKGAATGAYDLVANIVRRSVAATSGSILSGLSHADRIRTKPDVRIELNRETGERRLNASAALETDIDDDSGDGAITVRDPSGVVEEIEARDEREFERSLSFDAEYKLPIAGGELVSNGSLVRERTVEKVRSGTPPSGRLASDREQLWSAEAGAQYRIDAMGGELELLAVQRSGWLDAKAEEEDESFSEDTRTSETIARAEFRRGTDQLRFFGSLEAALNSLDGTALLIVDGSEVNIGGSDVRVTERRAEGAFGAIWSPSKTVSLEPSMRVEASTIRSSGDSPSREHFLFWKPRMRGTWASGSHRLQITAEREAAQLDFGDFVASAELDRDDVVAGATELRPPTTWSVSATFEQRFWADGVLTLTYRREWIHDLIDRVVVERDGELFDAVGNISNAKRRILKADLTLPFERIGISGMQLKASVTLIKGQVRDPITAEKRVISEDRPFEGDLQLSHDLPGGRWSWGAEASLAHHEHEFRFDEERREAKGSSFGAHVEFRPAADWRLRLEAENIGSRSLVETRREFVDTRASGILEGIEERRLSTAAIVMLSLRKTFGAGAD